MKPLKDQVKNLISFEELLKYTSEGIREKVLNHTLIRPSDNMVLTVVFSHAYNNVRTSILSM